MFIYLKKKMLAIKIGTLLYLNVILMSLIVFQIYFLDTVLLKSYQKRYCVLKDNILYYYEKPTDKRQLGAFILKGKSSLLIL